jgi:Gas vesicle synthesis protein GvpL/GvpF
MPGELERWAAGRAGELIARAEAEAVAELKAALLAAATGRAVAPRPPAPPAPPVAAPTGHGVWAYCVARADAELPDGGAGVHPDGEVAWLREGGLALLCSKVPLAEFGEEPLRRNLNDLAWLEKVARAHEAVLDAAMTEATVVPLRMCTIFERDQRVRAMLDDERDALVEALDALEGRQEWGVKVLADPASLEREARVGMDPPQEGGTAGGAYLQRRRYERDVRERAGALAAEVADQVHARVQDWAVDAVTRPPQNRELSGHEGEMLLNGAYLVDADRVDGLRELVADLEERHRALGVRIELTGPWPPYNFAPRGDAAALA